MVLEGIEEIGTAKWEDNFKALQLGTKNCAKLEVSSGNVGNGILSKCFISIQPNGSKLS